MRKEDFQKLFTENNAKLFGQLKDYMDVRFDEQSRDLKDYTDNRILASEKRIKQEIIEAVGDIIDHGIHPQLDSLDRRVTKLEHKLA